MRLLVLFDTFMKEDIHLKIQYYDELMLPHLFRDCVFDRTLIQCGRYEETVKRTGTQRVSDCILNRLHICFFAGWNVRITFS